MPSYSIRCCLCWENYDQKISVIHTSKFLNENDFLCVVWSLPLCPATPPAWCDPHRDLRPPCSTTDQRSAFQLQHSAATSRLPHSGGADRPQRSAAAGGGRRAGGGGRGGHREHRHGADSRGQQRHREQEAELWGARRDIQWRVGQRRASCCQSGVWSGTHDLLRPDRGIVGYWMRHDWVRGLTESVRASRGSCCSACDNVLIM